MHPASGVQPWEEAYPAMARAMGIDPATEKYVSVRTLPARRRGRGDVLRRFRLRRTAASPRGRSDRSSKTRGDEVLRGANRGVQPGPGVLVVDGAPILGRDVGDARASLAVRSERMRVSSCPRIRGVGLAAARADASR